MGLRRVVVTLGAGTRAAGFVLLITLGRAVTFAGTGRALTGADPVVVTVRRGFAAGFADTFGAGSGAVWGTGLAMMITGLPTALGAGAGVAPATPVGWKPQTCLRLRDTLGTQVILPSIPARM